MVTTDRNVLQQQMGEVKVKGDRLQTADGMKAVCRLSAGRL